MLTNLLTFIVILRFQRGQEYLTRPYAWIYFAKYPMSVSSAMLNKPRQVFTCLVTYTSITIYLANPSQS